VEAEPGTFSNIIQFTSKKFIGVPPHFHNYTSFREERHGTIDLANNEQIMRMVYAHARCRFNPRTQAARCSA
jgi:hypothetical protein